MTPLSTLFLQAIDESQGSGRSRSLANAIASFETLNTAHGQMLEHGLHGGPAYDLARDRFNALLAATRDNARQQNAA